MAILITGGTGFLGSYLARHLLDLGEGPIVLFDILINRENIADLGDNVTVVQGDQSEAVEVLEVVRQYDVTEIVHLGYAIGELTSQPERAIQVNVNGTNEIFQIARILGVRRVVWASSGAAYGYHPTIPAEAEPLREDAPMRPLSLYGACKLFNEHVAEDYARRFGLDHIGFRFTSIYGLGRSSRRLIGRDFYSRLVEHAVAGEPYTTPLADQLFNWTYVEDVARAIHTALRAPKPKVRIFNVSGDTRSVAESVEFDRSELVPGAPVEIGTQRERRIPILTNDLIRAELGWEPKFSMEEGMRDYVARLRGRQPAPVPRREG
ncbi:MAG TPA: NAD(P)-dependent oxidoreductase [Dehalococcoidia bacterium]|nr:NAD(P)-dependent oxidoreductase [Dehalococcoidia bacterium]